MATVRSPQGKPAPKPAESKPKPRKYKKWVLKPSSQCACKGCKRRAGKISTIKGVNTVDIDLEEQKVTVKGNIDSETLIKELKKTTSKLFELCPQCHQEQKGQGKGKSKEKESNPKSSREEEKKTVKTEVAGKSGGEIGNTTKAGQPVKSVLKPAIKSGKINEKRRAKRESNPESSRGKGVQKHKKQEKVPKRVHFSGV
ncbi:hypothetical protein SLEP1_g28851 [Rubroshorea leprosula]|uniref:HMA domain-containing protein n=1 Tax=Rubroshorea leprosula TaxID=152421 RepID=A0AAV5K6Z9_9ROSI|nr:hypothetical protein SLEP1_g28851 [Rubroshorea leprosula]